MLRIDFVSDVSCPWCAIGLASLEQALTKVAPEVTASLHFQPFELNPGMAPGGQDIGEHLTEKYGSSAEQQAAAREAIRQRGASVGFEFRMEGRDRIYNTFDAHRLLHWAEVEVGEEAQHALKKALFTAYFTDGQSPESHEVLLDAARKVGLPLERAAEVLFSGAFADEVRESEQFFLRAGIHSVPAIIIDRRHLISGGQPVEVFERALREIAAGAHDAESDAAAGERGAA